MSASLAMSPVVVDRTQVSGSSRSALVLRCAHEIDSYNSHELADAVRDGLARDADRLLVVDLREVTFLAASAISALLVGASTGAGGVARLRLVVGDCRPVLLVVKALDLYRTFSIHTDLADAVGGPSTRRGDDA